MTYAIAPGETLDFSFDFRGPTPGPALRTGQTIASTTAAIVGNAALTLVSAVAVADKVEVRVSASAAARRGSWAVLRCAVTTGGAPAGEVLVDEMNISVGP